MIPTLTKAEVRKVARVLRDRGLKLPRVGYQVHLTSRVASPFVARDARGYYVLEHHRADFGLTAGRGRY